MPNDIEQLQTFIRNVKKRLIEGLKLIPRKAKLSDCKDWRDAILSDLICPFTLEFPKHNNVVLCRDLFLYSKDNLNIWLVENDTSPLTREKAQILKCNVQLEEFIYAIEQCCERFKSTPGIFVFEATTTLKETIEPFLSPRPEAEARPLPMPTPPPAEQASSSGVSNRPDDAVLRPFPFSEEINNVIRQSQDYFDNKEESSEARSIAKEALEFKLNELKTSVLEKLNEESKQASTGTNIADIRRRVLILALIYVIPKLSISPVDITRYINYTSHSIQSLCDITKKEEQENFLRLRGTHSVPNDPVSKAHRYLFTYFLSPKEAATAYFKMLKLSEIGETAFQEKNDYELVTLDDGLRLDPRHNNNPFFHWMYAEIASNALNKITTPPTNVVFSTPSCLSNHAKNYFNVHMNLKNIANLWLSECLDSVGPLEKNLILQMMYDAELKDVKNWIVFSRQHNMGVLEKMCSMKLLLCCNSYSQALSALPDDYTQKYDENTEEIVSLLMAYSLLQSAADSFVEPQTMSALREKYETYSTAKREELARIPSGNSWEFKMAHNSDAILTNDIRPYLPIIEDNVPIYRGSIEGDNEECSSETKLPKKAESQYETHDETKLATEETSQVHITAPAQMLAQRRLDVNMWWRNRNPKEEQEMAQRKQRLA